jgi:hypothetical protein
LGGFGQVGGRTWHHNEILGVMELLRPDNHIGKGLNHVGAVQFWELLTGKEYEKDVRANSPLLSD